MSRVVFIGASSFSLKSLATVSQIEDCEVAGVLTVAQTFSISYRPEGVKMFYMLMSMLSVKKMTSHVLLWKEG